MLFLTFLINCGEPLLRVSVVSLNADHRRVLFSSQSPILHILEASGCLVVSRGLLSPLVGRIEDQIAYRYRSDNDNSHQDKSPD